MMQGKEQKITNICKKFNERNRLNIFPIFLKSLIGFLLLINLIVAKAAEDDIPLPPLPAPKLNVENKEQKTSDNELTKEQQEEVDRLLKQLQNLAEENKLNTEQNNNQNKENNLTSSKTGKEKIEDFDVSQIFSTPSSTFGTVMDPAFQNVIKRQFPLTPQQIKALREVFQSIQRAKAAPIEVPTPTVSTRNVVLAPGSVPPIIKMAKGYVSSIVFLDETGEPWPINNFSIGNSEAFDIKWDNQSNVLMIQGIEPYETGNMAVRLQGLDTPVMLTMVNDQQKVDYRVDLRVQGRGPNAKSPLIGNIIPVSVTPILQSFLDGIAPRGAEKLKVEGGNAQAWLLNNMLYLRTQLTLLSPSWTGTISSADGTKVYELPATPMLLVSHRGQTIELKVEGL